jgi:glutamyl-tRNA reductase
VRSRQSEARKADVIIAEGVTAYVRETKRLGAVDAVKDYRRMAEQLRQQELDKALRALAKGDDPEKVINQMSRGITNKLIHAPTTGLKQASADGREDQLRSARRLLGIAEPEVPVEEPESGDSLDISVDDTDHSRHTLQ